MPALDPYGVNASLTTYTLTSFPNGVNSMGIPTLGVIFKLTSANLLALQTTAINLVVAPSVVGVGTSWALVPTRATFKYKFVTTAYTLGNANNAFQIQYTGKTTALITAACAGLVDQTASTFVAVGANAAGNIASTNAQNLGLEVKLVGTTPALTLGDGTVNIDLSYTAVAIV